jgi:hypothetical protein
LGRCQEDKCQGHIFVIEDKEREFTIEGYIKEFPLKTWDELKLFSPTEKMFFITI